MSQVSQVYGGDEVNAVVLDPGSAWTRVGWSSEDGPSISFSTNYAERDAQRRYGDESTYLVRPNTEIKNPLKDSVVEDWDAATELWRSALSQMSAERTADYVREGPLLFSEPYWNSEEAKAKMMEFALEDLEAPATYIAKSAVLSMFSAGRGTGIVVDVGAQTLSVTPVVDGLILKKPARKSRRAGNFLTSKVSELLNNDVVCNYQVKSKRSTGPDEPAEYTLWPNLPQVTDSFHRFQVNRVMEQFKESMVQTSEVPLTKPKEAAAKRQFELPDGHKMEFGPERFTLGEVLFREEGLPALQDGAAHDEAFQDGTAQDSGAQDGRAQDGTAEKTAAPTAADHQSEEDRDAQTKMEVDESTEAKGSSDEWSSQGISALIIESLLSCDVDVRANLANNIVVTGGSTLVQGLAERINQDLQARIPMFKIRIFASGNMVERRNGAWIGGSILASLGTFHQLWVTRQEYEEAGAMQLAQKRFR